MDESVEGKLQADYLTPAITFSCDDWRLQKSTWRKKTRQANSRAQNETKHFTHRPLILNPVLDCFRLLEYGSIRGSSGKARRKLIAHKTTASSCEACGGFYVHPFGLEVSHFT